MIFMAIIVDFTHDESQGLCILQVIFIYGMKYLKSSQMNDYHAVMRN